MENKLFAWRPTTMTSGKRIWLKYYFQHKTLYDESTGRPPLNSLYFTWTETPQEKTWRLLKDSVVHNRNVWNTTELTAQDKQGGLPQMKQWHFDKCKKRENNVNTTI